MMSRFRSSDFHDGQKKAFQDFKVLRELQDANEPIRHGWVGLEILSISSIIREEHLGSYKECL